MRLSERFALIMIGSVLMLFLIILFPRPPLSVEQFRQSEAQCANHGGLYRLRAASPRATKIEAECQDGVRIKFTMRPEAER